jgi:YD repeat-containing protein
MPNGQTYGDTRVVVSGRVGAVAIDPANSNHILCGSAGGGVWEYIYDALGNRVVITNALGFTSSLTDQ